MRAWLADQMAEKLSARWHRLVHELAKFGTVGAVCAVIDIGLFNLLILGADLQPVRSKVISVTVAATCAYIGNRHWSFKHRARTGVRREFPIFVALNVIGLVIAAGVLYLSHYVLGFTSPLADNIAANVIGLGLGSIFRFWSYKRFVFLAPEPVPHAEAPEPVTIPEPTPVRRVRAPQPR